MRVTRQHKSQHNGNPYETDTKLNVACQTIIHSADKVCVVLPVIY